MKLIKEVSGVGKVPLPFMTERFDEAAAQKLLNAIIEKAKEVIVVVTEAYKEPWTNNPSTSIRAVFGHWFVKADRHFRATINLCEGTLRKEHDLSTVADVHHRQVFELFIQARYYASLDQKSKEKLAKKIYAIGCIDYLEKIEVLKDHEYIKDGYQEISDKLSEIDKELVDEIMDQRKKKSYQWFGRTFSQLAKDVSRAGEDLGSIYQLISTDVHGSWNLALDVDNPEPGHLVFRPYPNKTTLYVRSAEMLHQVTKYYIKLWNDVAKSVGAQEVYFVSESDE